MKRLPSHGLISSLLFAVCAGLSTWNPFDYGEETGQDVIEGRQIGKVSEPLLGNFLYCNNSATLARGIQEKLSPEGCR